MDIHDEAAQTEGKHSISIGLIDAVTSFVVFPVVDLVNNLTTDQLINKS